MQHLDEGTIHAWLDDALTADEAARVEQHASECAECAVTVAEARGLVAGASRILSALDDVPGVVPAAGAGRGEAGGVAALQRERLDRHALRPRPPARRPLWSRPATLAVAASVILMAGTAIVWQEGARPRSSEGMLSAAAPVVSRTEASVPLATAPQADTRRDTSAVGAAAPARGAGLTGGTASSRPRRTTDGTGGDTRRRAASAPVAQRAPAAGAVAPAVEADAKALSVVPPTAAPAPVVANDQARKAPPMPTQLSELAVTSATSGDSVKARRAAVPRAAAARSRSERAIAPTRAEVPQRAAARVDSVYHGRADTVGRVDTVGIEAPAPPGLRAPGGVGITARPFPVTGCYEVVEGGLPKSITLTTKPVWSGAAEHRFVANAPGAIGYWSQPRSGDVIVVIAGALVTARIDVSTGELRGTARRGRGSKPFLARRCR